MSDGAIVEVTADGVDRMAAGDDELAAAWTVYREKWERWGSRCMRRGASLSTSKGRRSLPPI